MLQDKEWSEDYLILSKSLGKPNFQMYFGQHQKF